MSTTYPAAHAVIDHIPASEVRAHERTYHRFLELVRYAVLAHLAGGGFIVLAFFTNAGWGAALIVAAIVLAGGLYLIRRLDVGGPAVQVANLVMTTVEEEAHAEPADQRVVMLRGRAAAATAPDSAEAAPQAAGQPAYLRWLLLALYVIAAAGWLALSAPTLATMLGDTF
jgi:hypothetical protein